MKRIHVMNIGYPKCGTTWLWDTLVKNNSIADHPIKENLCLIAGTPVDEYRKQYSADVTANFATTNFALDRYVIEQLANIPEINVSIIIREHVSLLWSLYEFRKTSTVDFQTFCYQMYDSKWFVRTDLAIQRWKQCFGDRFKIFWYDDLKNNNLEFYLNYCNKMGLDSSSVNLPEKINVTRYRSIMPKLDQDLVDLLKSETEKLNVYK